MSLLTTTALQAAPSAATGTTIATGAVWTYGSWVQVLASAAADVTVAGLVYSAGLTGAHTEVEVDLGMGGAGAEVSLGTLRFTSPSATTGGPGALMLPAPVGGIPAGSRVALRARSSSSIVSPVLVLLYYLHFDSDAILPAPACVPSGANGVTVTPNATAWANSSYVQLTAGLASDSSLYGLTTTINAANVDGEWDLATGGAGAETVITTLRWSSKNTSGGLVSFLPLSAVHPVAAGTRIAIRLRKGGTAVVAYTVALLYYAGTSLLTPTAQPYVWGPL